MNPSKPQSALNRFFFAEEVPFGMAIMRIVTPLVASIPMWLRFPRVRELYTTDGAPAQLFELFGEGTILPVLPPGIAVPLYGVMLLTMFMAVIGFRTRLSLFLAVPLYVYFGLLDAVGTMTKYNVIASHLMLLLAVSNAGAIWSVDAILKRRSEGSGFDPQPPKFPVWPARLTQLLFCYVYFGAGMTKIQTEGFFSGEQMRYWMLSNWNYDNPIGETMAMWSPLLLIGAYVAVVWEILFGFLVFQKRSRLVILGMGIMFHFMTWVTLGLKIFPSICVSGYFAYIMQDDFLKIRHWVRRWVPTSLPRPGRLMEVTVSRIPKLVPAGVAWVCVIAASAIVSTEAELQMDLYGVNNPNGRMQLEKMDADVARTMIRDEQKVREQDKFFSFDIGSFSVGNQLANRRTVYEYGDSILAQCNLNPPHEDLWVECLLQDEEGRMIEQFGQFVTRDMLRANFTYHIGNKLLPGKYQMVLRSANKDIYRRPFELIGEPPEQAMAAGVLTN